MEIFMGGGERGVERLVELAVGILIMCTIVVNNDSLSPTVLVKKKDF